MPVMRAFFAMFQNPQNHGQRQARKTRLAGLERISTLPPRRSAAVPAAAASEPPAGEKNGLDCRTFHLAAPKGKHTPITGRGIAAKSSGAQNLAPDHIGLCNPGEF